MNRCYVCGERMSHTAECHIGCAECGQFIVFGHKPGCPQRPADLLGRGAEVECNGICLWAADIGVPEAGDVVAYPHPDCPIHGDPQSDRAAAVPIVLEASEDDLCPACDSEICRCW